MPDTSEMLLDRLLMSNILGLVALPMDDPHMIEWEDNCRQLRTRLAALEAEHAVGVKLRAGIMDKETAWVDLDIVREWLAAHDRVEGR